MSKTISRTSESRNEHDSMDVTDEISIKEEKVDEIKKEIVDLNLDVFPSADIKNEIEEFPNDNFFINPKDIPGIKKIVNIEDILKNSLNNADSTISLSSNNTESELQNSKISLSKNAAVSGTSASLCNCMQHFKHYCNTCDVVMIYKANETECPVCKSTLKLRCSRCKRKFKVFSKAHKYLFQNSTNQNLLSNKKKEITLQFKKQRNFFCFTCPFQTKSESEIYQHVKNEHTAVEKVKQNSKQNSKIDKKQKRKANNEFIESYCPKCFKKAENLPRNNLEKSICEECQSFVIYQCTFCKKSYKSLTHLRPHIKNICLMRFNHLTLHCDHCYFTTEDKSQLELHIKLVHIPVTCEHCKREFANSGAIKQHKTKGCHVEKTKRKTELYTLNVQNSKTESTYSTLLHEEGSYQVVQYHPEELYDKISKRPKDLYNSNWLAMIDYYCLLCDGQSTKKISKYKPWCKKCNIKYEYRCKICEKIYDGYPGICKHVQSECPARYSLLCSMCNFTSAQKQILISHIKNKHTVFKCLQCESRYHGYLSLRKHLLSNCKIENIHTEKHVQKLIALYCKHCYKRVINFEGSALKPCLKCTSIMSYQCLKCNELFDDLKMAQKHVKTLCKPEFNCTQCNFEAYTQCELDTHIKNLHDSKQCEDCGVEFRDKHIFKKHRREELRRKEEKTKLLGKQEEKRIKLS